MIQIHSNEKDRACRQCYLNITCLFRHYHAPSLGPPIAMQRDRVIFDSSAEFIVWIENMHLSFRPWDRGIRAHQIEPGMSTALRGWRETENFCSCQVIEHSLAVEIDFDLGNPDGGLAPAFLHGLEVLFGYGKRAGKTDPFRVRKSLRKRGIEVPLVS